LPISFSADDTGRANEKRPCEDVAPHGLLRWLVSLARIKRRRRPSRLSNLLYLPGSRQGNCDTPDAHPFFRDTIRIIGTAGTCCNRRGQAANAALLLLQAVTRPRPARSTWSGCRGEAI